MRKVFIFLIFSTMLFMVVSCSNNNNNTSGDQITTINDLVYEQKKIVNIEITQEQKGTFVWKLIDAAEIQAFLETISNIALERLPSEQDIAFMDKGLKFVEQGLYRIGFYGEDKNPLGDFLIWSDGKIYIRDNNVPDGEKVISYLSKVNHPEIYKKIMDKTNEMTAEGQKLERISATYWLGDEGEKTIEYYIKTVEEEFKDILSEKGDIILSGFEEYDLMLELVLAKKEGKWGLYDNRGSKILDHSYEAISNHEMPNGYKANGLVGVRNNGMWGAIDQVGKIVIQPEFEYIDLNHYEEVEPFIKVRKNGKFGYLTRKGKTLVDPIWDTTFMDVLNVLENIIFVKEGDKWGGIRIRDEKAAPVDWTLIPPEEAQLAFNNWKYDYQHNFYVHQIKNGETSIAASTKIFFNEYFRKNSRRIRSLPEFSQEQNPDFNELAKFVYENSENNLEDWSITKDDFSETVKRYFGDLNYIDQTSTYLEYIDGKYIPKGWSDHGFYIYELTDLAKGQTREGKDRWKAQITGYYFYELDGDPDETYWKSRNAQVVWKKIKEDVEYKGLNFWQACDRLAWNNPGDILEPAGEWLIEFIINDPTGDIYFTYLSCQKKGFKID